MRHKNSTYTYRHHKISSHILLVALTSLLFACSQQPSTDAQHIQSLSNHKSATTDSQTLQASAAGIEPVMIPVTESSTSLKIVSATVYKTPDCGCCKSWIEHIENHGLKASVQHPEDLSLFKDRYDVPQQMRTCHTAVTTDGFVFEGHVPAKYMAQFLASPPAQAIGLAVPGMPVGSPGMEQKNKFMPHQVMQMNKDGTVEVHADSTAMEQPGKFVPYQVMQMNKDGTTEVYAEITSAQQQL